MFYNITIRGGKNMKKFLTTLLFVCTILLTFCMVNASAETDGIYTYSISNGEATITECSDSVSGELVIPDTLGGYPVTYIGVGAFGSCISLTSITISDSVTNIGDRAFYGCDSLESITIGRGVTSIGGRAFDVGNKLNKVNITDLEAWCNINFADHYSNPLNIAGELYLNGVLVTNIAIPDSVTSIGSRAFSGCSSLVSITIPDSVTSIGNWAFNDCSNLASVAIPDSVTSIGDGAFCECTRLESIIIPDSVTSIGNYAFDFCARLISITIPDGVTSIGSQAFHYCTRLISISIPDSVTSIGDGAFYSCTSLENIIIPDSVTSIGDHAFGSCARLISITIPDGVTGIGDSAFNGCSSLESIIIPDSVTSIGNYAFEDCARLISVTIPDGVTSIGDAAFSRCGSIKGIIIPGSVTSIGDYAFYDCNNLRVVCLPVELKYVRNDVFKECSGIEVVFYAGSEIQWNEMLFYSGNESITNAKIVYNATKKTYKLETNCDATLEDVSDYAIFVMPTVENGEMTLLGWYTNRALSGDPVTFPYYGDITTLYAAWTDRTGETFDKAFITKADCKYTVTTIENGQLVYFEFVPNRSKEYHFYTIGSKDTYGYLYDASKSQLGNNNDGGEGNNFYISYNLTAGETYYIAAKIYNGSGTFTLVVEEPVDYRINEITIKDMSGNSLEAIPTRTFLATVSFTNVSSSEDTVIILAQYTDADAFLGLMYIQTEDVPTGSTIKLTIPVDNSKGDVTTLKAFCWESFDSITPMGNSVSFPAE
ncbi:MAG: leucine-rich repeat domain-containing protein [Clostridia bacterium]|nr:leucine-rich repeat domain-containing protein [Clostridia bacterium]